MSTQERQDDLVARHQKLVAAEPGLRIRERAHRLDVSEAELVARQLGVTARPVACRPVDIYPRLPALGRIMCLTRNPWAVHERYGQFQRVEVNPKVGLVLGTDIDLRLFFSHWKHAWEVTGGGRTSLQFFDAHGVAIQKIFQTDDTDRAAWKTLMDEFALAPASGSGSVQPAEASASSSPVDGADAALPIFEPLPLVVRDHGAMLDAAVRTQLRERWLAMTDPHQFWPMLQALKLSRITAVRAVGEDQAQQVDRLAVETVLQKASDTDLPIMVFVGNQAAVQIHGGTVKKLMRTGPWYNVLDPAFNLHLNTDAIVSCWVVSRPTDDGPVTSLELYADNGDLIAQFFGLRKPGNPELKDWRALMQSLCRTPLAD